MLSTRGLLLSIAMASALFGSRTARADEPEAPATAATPETPGLRKLWIEADADADHPHVTLVDEPRRGVASPVAVCAAMPCELHFVDRPTLVLRVEWPGSGIGYHVSELPADGHVRIHRDTQTDANRAGLIMTAGFAGVLVVVVTFAVVGTAAPDGCAGSFHGHCTASSVTELAALALGAVGGGAIALGAHISNRSVPNLRVCFAKEGAGETLNAVISF